MRKGLFLLLVSVGILLLVFVNFNLPSKNKIETSGNAQITAKDESIIFQKSESWGPCPPEDVPCKLDTIVYSNGSYEISGQSSVNGSLPMTSITQFQDYINISKLMIRPCLGLEAHDYSAVYTIQHMGKSREIDFPSCEKEMAELESLLQIPDPETQGGA